MTSPHAATYTTLTKGRRPYLYPNVSSSWVSCLSPSDSKSHHPHHRRSFTNYSQSFDDRLTRSLPISVFRMKFTLIVAAAAGVLAAPYGDHAEHASSVSVPVHHSVSVPAYEAPSCVPEASYPSVTPVPVAPEEEEEHEVHEVPAPSYSVAAPLQAPSAAPLPEHEVPESEHEVEHDTPLSKTIKDITVLVIEIKELVAGDVELIKSTLADPTSLIPAELLSIITTLKVHLSMIPTIITKKLLALLLKLTTTKLTEVDVKALLGLVDEIKFILTLVESCIEDMVAHLEADILKLVAKELKTVLDLILTTASPIVKFVLAVVGTVEGLTGLVAKVTAVVGEIEVVEGLTSKVLELVPVPLPL
ncbi:hypothetical protein QBC34DRAFT_416469 [Podospora aff. communis PSN243]|uniref:Uncharacterized protein n=1 Tax=Podospora aff. communis PSN243 TaxID=3040156 RepID=A0AAV9G6C5_9PEZI|nr:hypothetical protein QBC34DRAFT_416469 [Podospora aff. communis PSN243]